ncbi:MAG: PAS domain-containing [Geobacteraceae bacterium]|nr:MAG: PAS domain-containing [Geobacteraceae bacterium]
MSNSAKVLVIDDEKLARANLRAFFEDMRYQVVEAANGREGLEVVSSENPDIVLTDLRMPVMDGLAFIAALREKWPDTPVIAISGAGTLKVAIEAVRIGAWDYVTKPVRESGELEVRVKRALEGARLLAENRRYYERLEEQVQEQTLEIRQSEERYRRLLSSVTSYVYTVTINNGQPVNTVHFAGCEALTGFTPEEFSVNSGLWWQIVYEEDRPVVNAISERILNSPGPLAIEHRLCHKNGLLRWIGNTLVPHRDNEGVLVSYDGIITDITERKEAEEKVRSLNADLEQRVADRTTELEQANRQLESFAFSISHDLRAPLRHICGFSRILAEDYRQQLEEKGKDYLKRIINGCDKMDKLIEAMLEFSRYSRQPINRMTVETNHLVREVFTEFETELSERQIELDIGNMLPCEADPTLLHQVYFNLLGNALKYTRKREVARVEIGSYQSDRETVYYVKDNGAGFDNEYAQRLFGVFQRLHRADEFEGTGVGLAIVQNIVQRHGGRVWAEAEPDIGATFYFVLPVVNNVGNV